jgi:hypothetical protein
MICHFQTSIPTPFDTVFATSDPGGATNTATNTYIPRPYEAQFHLFDN